MSNYKERLYALYWGQKIGSIYLSDNDQRHDFEIGVIHGLNFNWINLKPISMITNEHAIEVADSLHPTIIKKEDKIRFGKTICKRMFDDYDYSLKEGFIMADFFRRKGYAVPFDGKNVEDQVKDGDIKLRS